MSAVETAATFLTLVLAVFLALSGVSFFIVGVIGRMHGWIKQYAWSALFLTCAYYLFRLVFDVP
jgi:hypothetical protein